jgi:hypothetical protein
MSSVITALVTIRYQWVRIAGLERVLMGLADNRNPSLSGTLVLPVTRYDTADASFVELAFCNPAAELEGLLFVPKAEVIAILKTTDPDHLPKVGYRGRVSEQVLDTSFVIEAAPAQNRTAELPADSAGDLAQTPAAAAENAVPKLSGRADPSPAKQSAEKLKDKRF